MQAEGEEKTIQQGCGCSQVCGIPTQGGGGDQQDDEWDVKQVPQHPCPSHYYYYSPNSLLSILSISFRSIRDAVSQYLLSQPPVAALSLVNSWFSHWRKQIISSRSFVKKITFQKLISRNSTSKDSKVPSCLSQKNISKLQELYICNTEFREEDKRSMLDCFSRYQLFLQKLSI